MTLCDKFNDNFSGVTIAADGTLTSIDRKSLIPCLHGLASTGFTNARESGEIELVSATTDRKVVNYACKWENSL